AVRQVSMPITLWIPLLHVKLSSDMTSVFQFLGFPPVHSSVLNSASYHLKIMTCIFYNKGQGSALFKIQLLLFTFHSGKRQHILGRLRDYFLIVTIMALMSKQVYTLSMVN